MLCMGVQVSVTLSLVVEAVKHLWSLVFILILCVRTQCGGVLIVVEPVVSPRVFG